MKLDAAYFGTREIALIINMMYMIVLYKGKHASKIAYDTGLSAVMDITVPYDMGTYRLLTPAVKLSYKRAVTLCLCTILEFVIQPLIVIALLPVFAKRYSRAFGFGNIAVLDDPPL